MKFKNTRLISALACVAACAVDVGDPLDTTAEGSGDETAASSETDTGTDTTDSGDGDGDGDGDGTGIEIAGDYTDEWGMMHTINGTDWTQGTDGYSIASYDNAADFVIAQNGPMNAFNADLWSRLDWAWVGADLFYCQTIYDGATQTDAEATPRADDADPATGGCGMFAWTKLN